MSRRALDAAGIHDPDLRRDLAACRRLNAKHGRTYYLATLLLPAAKRPWVHGLYGFARQADDIVDVSADPAALVGFADRVRGDIAQGTSDDPVTRALIATLERWDIPREHIEAFLTSMLMDLTVTSYNTWEDLLGYVEGSAAVIGLQMLPILETVVPLPVAAPYARDLGIAFQLTNFLRDVGEDLDRGRVYLPQEDLEAFGLSTEKLRLCDAPFRRLMAFEVARTRELYRTAALGIRLLHPSSRPCVTAALTLYGGILDEIEKADYAVLDQRVSVSLGRRLRVALPAVPRRPTS